MDTKVFDTGSNVDVVTNKGRFTAAEAGFYWFVVRGATNGGNEQIAALFKNGSRYLDGTRTQGAGVIIGSVVTGVIQLAVNDYVEPYYYTASLQPFNVGQTYETYFSGFRVSAT